VKSPLQGRRGLPAELDEATPINQSNEVSNLTPGLLFVHRFAIETFTGCFFSLRPTGNPERELNQRSRAPMNQIRLSESAPLK